MSYILTATYPFAAGHVAAEYACGLANVLRLPLRIVHAYIVPITMGDMPMPIVPVEEAHAMSAERMGESLAKLRASYPQVTIMSDVVYGAPADVLDDEAAANPPLLTVIGNEGGADGATWIGSDTADMLRESSRTILTVPHAALFRHPKRVCLACDGRSIRDGLPLIGLLQLQAALGFSITVMHVLADDEQPVPFTATALGQQLAGTDTTYTEALSAGPVDKAITAFAKSHGMDWLAVVPHHYGFWEGLFHKSHTSRMLHLAHIPVLALHE